MQHITKRTEAMSWHQFGDFFCSSPWLISEVYPNLAAMTPWVSMELKVTNVKMSDINTDTTPQPPDSPPSWHHTRPSDWALFDEVDWNMRENMVNLSTLLPSLRHLLFIRSLWERFSPTSEGEREPEGGGVRERVTCSFNLPGAFLMQDTDMH